MHELAELAQLRADAPAAATGRAGSRLMEAIGAGPETSPRHAPRRRSRRMAALSGAAVLAAAAAVAVPLLAGGTAAGHRTAASHPAAASPGAPAGHGVQLAAWTVTRLPASVVSAEGLPAGVVAVTVSRDDDRAGLQAALAADGIPAFVTLADGQAGKTSTPAPPPACDNTGLSRQAYIQVADRIYLDAMKRIPSSYDSKQAPRGFQVFVIPSAIPKGIGLYITVSFGPGRTSAGLEGLIKAGPGCTGT